MQRSERFFVFAIVVVKVSGALKSLIEEDLMEAVVLSIELR